LNYEISKDEEILSKSKVLKTVETQASFIDFIVIPQAAKSGSYQIKARISDNGDLDEEVEASFQIVHRAGQLRSYFFILLGVLVLVGILVVISIVLHLREKT